MPATERVHVLVPHGTRRNSTGFVVVQCTARLDERSRLQTSIEVCSVTRAVADTARTATELSEVRAYLAEAAQRRRTTVAELFAELDAGPVRGSAVLRTALGEVSAGARSAPEGASTT